jgi:hypothetical protein
MSTSKRSRAGYPSHGNFRIAGNTELALVVSVKIEHPWGNCLAQLNPGFDLLVEVAGVAKSCNFREIG